MTEDDLTAMVLIAECVLGNEPLPPHSVVALDRALAATVLHLHEKLRAINGDV